MKLSKILKKHGNQYHKRNISEYKNKKFSEEKYLLNLMKPICQEYDIENMLEIGCGSGFTLDYLNKGLALNAYGVDPSDDAIKLGREFFPKLNLIEGVSFDLSMFEDHSFDYIHLGFFMYLLDEDHRIKTVSEVTRILKNYGFLSIFDFDTPYIITKKYDHGLVENIYKLDQSYLFTKSSCFTLIDKKSFSTANSYFDKNVEERMSIQLLFREDSKVN
tara:strand:+ start:1250 stop:1903 length:654 start_codon:yes stop_codon:yes gene_type:complete